jgi:hypothetical protein
VRLHPLRRRLLDLVASPPSDEEVSDRIRILNLAEWIGIVAHNTSGA